MFSKLYGDDISNVFGTYFHIVENMILSNISTENHTGSETMPLMENFGEIKVLSQDMIFVDGKQVEV